MNVEGYAESDKPAPRRQRRPALYPWVNVPAPFSTVAGAGCLTAVALWRSSRRCSGLY